MKCLFVPAFVICASTALATPFDGVYRFNNSWDCVSIGSDGGAIAIKGNIFRGVENDCTLENAVQVRGMNATLYDADCTGEGLYSRERIMLMRKTYGADGIYLIRNGIVGEFERCPS